jgi:hypothetical protein
VIGYPLEDYVVAVRRLLDRPGPAPRHVFLGFCLNDVSASSKAEILAAIAGSPASVSAAEGLLATVNAFLRERSKLYLVLKSLLIDSSHRYYSADASRYDDREAMKRALKPREITRMLAARQVCFSVLIFPYGTVRARSTTAWRPSRSQVARTVVYQICPGSCGAGGWRLVIYFLITFRCRPPQDGW